MSVQRRVYLLILSSVVTLMMLIIGACQRAASPISTSIPATTILTIEPTSSATTTEMAYPQPLFQSPTPQVQQPSPLPSEQINLAATATKSPTASATSVPTNTQQPVLQPQASDTATPVPPTPTATETSASEYPGPVYIPIPTSVDSETYPGPIVYPTVPPNQEIYPGPENTPTPGSNLGAQASPTATVYPGSATSTQRAFQSPPGSTTPTAPGGELLRPSPTVSSGTIFPTPTELPPRPPLSPPPAGSAVTIWHSWSTVEADALRSVIRSFQRMYPDVTFTLSYIPLDDLFSTYEEAAYFNQGPSLLLGPASWGPELYNESLVSDLAPFVPASTLANINPAGLVSGKYHSALISLPLSLHGTLMFRNSEIIYTAPTSVDELIHLSQQVTHGGVVGSYLERGSDLSAANILGLGGGVIGENDNPLFNSAAGLEWLDLLAAYDEAGAVTFNTNLDIQMFKRGRVGIIINDSWNIKALASAIGADRLVIDPWPSFDKGHMSGWVEADSMYLNANVSGNDQFAALSFMGYLLDQNVQMRLAEVGHIPSIMTTKPRDALIQQAMTAFLNGVPYPITSDSQILSMYWEELDHVILDVFQYKTSPELALQNANDNIIQTIKVLRNTP